MSLNFFISISWRWRLGYGDERLLNFFFVVYFYSDKILLFFRKIFVGGIAYDVTNDDLSSYFSQFGEVAVAQVKYDRNTGRSRGFAFVEFTTGEACKTALSVQNQTLKNKQIEVKPAKSRENKKVFVGGLPAEHPGLWLKVRKFCIWSSICFVSEVSKNVRRLPFDVVKSLILGSVQVFWLIA